MLFRSATESLDSVGSVRPGAFRTNARTRYSYSRAATASESVSAVAASVSTLVQRPLFAGFRRRTAYSTAPATSLRASSAAARVTVPSRRAGASVVACTSSVRPER